MLLAYYFLQFVYINNKRNFTSRIFYIVFTSSYLQYIYIPHLNSTYPMINQIISNPLYKFLPLQKI
jgi:hypothetical protein